jgi:Antitoxin FitA-like, ribbon-helix-helix
VKQLTIRGVADELHNEIKIKADQHNMSINRYVLALIKKHVGFSDSGLLHGSEYHDLDYLAGTWSQEAYQEFRELLREQRPIDLEMWQ